MKQLSMYEDTYTQEYQQRPNCHSDRLESKNSFRLSPTVPVSKRAEQNVITPISLMRSDQPESTPIQTHYGQSATPGKANVTEIILARDKAECMQLLLPMLSYLNQEQRWLAWIDPPVPLLKQWREQHQPGATSDIMVLRSNATNSAFELTEMALKAGTCHAVIAWTRQLSQSEFSQLEQASCEGNSHGIILRYR